VFIARCKNPWMQREQKKKKKKKKKKFVGVLATPFLVSSREHSGILRSATFFIIL
jgi:hypothetical protein